MLKKNHRTLSEICDGVRKDYRFSSDLQGEINDLVREAYESGAKSVVDVNRRLSEQFARKDAEFSKMTQGAAA